MPYMQRPVRMENVREDEEEVREGGCEDEEDGVERQMESATRGECVCEREREREDVCTCVCNGNMCPVTLKTLG